jgi:hypothetical protein
MKNWDSNLSPSEIGKLAEYLSHSMRRLSKHWPSAKYSSNLSQSESVTCDLSVSFSLPLSPEQVSILTDVYAALTTLGGLSLSDSVPPRMLSVEELTFRT